VVRQALPVVERERGVCCAVEQPLGRRATEKAAAQLQAIADSTRLGMLLTISHAAQPVCVCDFAAAYGLSQPTISHHMGKLRAAGLVRASKRGIWTFYSAVNPLPAVVQAALDALA